MTPPRIAVVTDSTARVGEAGVPLGPGGDAVRVVPLHVVVDDLSYAEDRSISVEDLTGALRAGRRVSTSRPSPAAFTAQYAELAARGFDGIVSLHLSGQVSGTAEAAELAAADAAVPVRVLDSGVVGAALGLAVRDAVDLARSGADLDAVAEAAAARAASSTTAFCVDSLEWLRRGGRISGVRALVGTALAVRPVLGLREGRIEAIDRVRTTARATARVQDLAARAVGDASAPCDIVVQHLDAAERAEAMRAALAALPGVRSARTVTVGAVVGAHCGPGTLGVVVAPVPAENPERG